MITQISSFNARGVAGDLRRNTQAMPKHTPNLINRVNFGQENQQQQQKSPVWTGTSIVLGAILFMMLYFLISGSRRA